MTKPKTDWEINRSLASTIDAYDSATDTYDGDGSSAGINYYDGYNAAQGSLNSNKEDTNWTPT